MSCWGCRSQQPALPTELVFFISRQDFAEDGSWPTAPKRRTSPAAAIDPVEDFEDSETQNEEGESSRRLSPASDFGFERSSPASGRASSTSNRKHRRWQSRWPGRHRPSVPRQWRFKLRSRRRAPAAGTISRSWPVRSGSSTASGRLCRTSSASSYC